MVTAARKGLLICGAVALLGGGLAGMGLGNYAQSGAFEFYKHAPPPAVQDDFAATSDSAGYYPISRTAPVPDYPENPSPPRLTIARPAVPADYSRAAAVEVETPPAAEEQAALPEPIITPQRGSWSTPAEDEPAAATPGDTAS